MLDKIPQTPIDTPKGDFDWMNETGSLQSEFFQKSELARKFRGKEISTQDAVDLAIEALRVFGHSYVYERREWRGKKEYTRKIYIVPYLHAKSDYRIDGEDDAYEILVRVGVLSDEELDRQPSIEDLLKGETRVSTHLVKHLNTDQDNLAVDYTTHKTFELVSKV